MVYGLGEGQGCLWNLYAKLRPRGLDSMSMAVADTETEQWNGPPDLLKCSDVVPEALRHAFLGAPHRVSDISYTMLGYMHRNLEFSE